MSGNAINIKNVSKSFARPKGEIVLAVDDITLDIQRGEIFGLLGPNGAGKTTTLRLISTVLKPTYGSIIVDGFDTVTQSDDVRRRLGFLSGNTGLYRKLKAYEMVEYFGKLYGMDEQVLATRINKLFTLLDMNEFRDVMCESLSSGTRQKVSIARTIVHDPPIIVFDEPTATLDPLVARTLLQFISRLAEEGKTVILSTHIMQEAEKMCTRVGIIHRGKLLACGTIPEILEHTQTKSLEEAFFALATTDVWE